MSDPDLFDRALALQEAGRLAEAEALCRTILKAEPHHHQALLLAGMLRTQGGDLQTALVLIGRSLGLAPEVPLGHFYRALVLAALNRGEEAIAAYRKTLELDPDFVEAHYNLGRLLLQANRPAEALEAFTQALRLRPELTEAACASAVVLSQLNRRGEALAALDAVLAKQHDFIPALAMRSDLLSELGRHQEALAQAERALALAPNQAAAEVSRCTALIALGRFAEAQAAIARALAFEPDSARALAMRAVLHREAGRLGPSLADCDRAVALAPGDAVLHCNRGDTLLSLGEYGQALDALDRAVSLNPLLAKSFASRALVLRHQQRFEAALADCERALGLDASLGRVAGERFLLAGLLCDWRRRDAWRDDLEDRVRAGQCVAPWVIATAIDNPALQLTAARRMSGPAVAARPETPPHQRLRIAYLSPDFHEHPTAHLMVELIERHDRARVETFGICLHGGPGSAIRQRIGQAFEHFVEAGSRSDAEIADLMRQNEIDIAVDLAGHAGGARPGVFQARPAPLAVNFAGHPGTLGAGWADYILADAVVIPPGNEPYFSEQVVRLPHCYLPSDTRFALPPTPSRAEAGLPETGFVFCSFNNSYKLTPQVFGIWMRLLCGTQGSVLWLLAEDAATRRHLLAEARARGVAPERLVFAERRARGEYLARLPLADCFLDSLPCNAHTTASDALWMGVPLVTCMGQSFAARVAGSMLKAVGLEELIAPDLAAYEALALALAHSPQRLADLRARLAASRSSSPLFDMARLARHVEAAYETMWRRHLEGLPPAAFDVAALPGA
jgi:protein O-GlcNAc transferase